MSKRKLITYVTNINGCHLCTSHHVNIHGYPCIWANGRNQNMHRVLFEEKKGKIKKSNVIRHTCDNRLCINLDHLISGTAADNAADCAKRKRHNPPVGERSGTVKLTLKNVIYIRKSKLSERKLATKFKVSQSTVNRIKNNKRWSHIL
jgi:hypothetical protein